MFSLSISKILFIRWKAMIRPPCLATELPQILVPAPLGVTGIFSLFASRITPQTSSVEEGTTIASGLNSGRKAS
jgi:hypothetical protein